MATCRRCGAPILWAKTDKGVPIPLDPAPSPDGNLRLVAGIAYVAPRPKPPAETAQRSLFAGDPDERGPVAEFEPAPLYLSHFVSCPHAAEFRNCVDRLGLIARAVVVWDKRTPDGGGTGRRVRSPRSTR